MCTFDSDGSEFHARWRAETNRMIWERGAISPPPRPLTSRTSASRFFYSRLQRIGRGLQASVKKTVMRGADESLCGTPMFFTNIDGTAALCRPDMPHTLRSPTGGVEAATAPSFMMAQGFASATGTRALTPRDPVFTSFPEKRSKTRKAENMHGHNGNAIQLRSLRHKPPKSQKLTLIPIFLKSVINVNGRGRHPALR